MGNIIPINIIEQRALKLKSEIDEHNKKSFHHFSDTKSEVTDFAINSINKMQSELTEHIDLVKEMQPIVNKNKLLISKIEEGKTVENNELKIVLNDFNNSIIKLTEAQKASGLKIIELLENFSLERTAKVKSDSLLFMEDIKIKEGQLKIINYLIEKYNTSPQEIRMIVNEELSELIDAIDKDKFTRWTCNRLVLAYKEFLLQKE